MVNPILDVKQECRKLVEKAVASAINAGTLPEAELPAFNIEIPSDVSHGDFSTNAAMGSARAFHKAPKMIADAIIGAMNLEGSSFEKVEVAGPGFINFFLGRNWFSQDVLNVLNEKDGYGRTAFGDGKRILVEFVSANPTGPMHIGNARGGAIGDTLASVLDWAGFGVNREFYINDAGNQINKFGLSLSLRYLQICDGQKGSPEDTYMPEDSYHGQDIIDHAQAFYDLHGDAFKDVSEEERRKALVDYALPLNIQGLERDLLRYRIKYDCWFKESSLHESGEAAKVVDMLTEKGYTYESEGAIWFKAPEYGADKDFVLRRSNGFFTYVVPDIAYHYNKLVTRGYDKAIDVLGADHHGYVPRLKAALQALGVDPDRLDVVLMQMVRLVRGGEVVKLSKRSGKAITLVTLLDDIPIDAARFFFNLREANSQFDFDLDLAVSQTSKNPVYYVQYAHARICSILKAIEEEGIVISDFTPNMANLLVTDEEKELVKYMASLPNTINDSARTYDPAKVTHYVVEIATMFHKFYSQCRVKGEDEHLMQARLGLCKAVKQIIANILDMLKITCPESM